ncbi:MAG: cobalt chelatase [Euryarchaeota archaeon]|nr:cobalt chelatase [Euryarchaeota archaeon]MEC8577664.1 (2Fe-2S) ferredoxin domain-containing protein [Candidatus Thermoplasmatota archaeon]MEE2647977.1 (2Fe-2S) ferredoxin domain-containing protein [Candidatus Thermoplasmatota archaeon]|tara:strand:- start:517 stop:846 length:330 start_codon:yes stop_codon:yes gene_type:complete
MKPTVNICDGCCCGRVNKSNLAVPKDELKSLWREHELSKHVNLRVTSCLGPCSRANVTLVSTAEGRTWLGGIASEDHYQTLVDWAQGVAQQGVDHPLPESLLALKFTPV